MGKKNIKPKTNINIKNRRGEYDYTIIDKYTAGIVLTGTEIKSIRLGKAGLVDTFCYIHNKEIWVKNMYIAEYEWGSYNNHTTRRDRKLLLNKKEIENLAGETNHLALQLFPLDYLLMKTEEQNLLLDCVKVKRNTTNGKTSKKRKTSER